MLPYKRSDRVGHSLRKALAEIIMNRLKDPRLGFVTITEVDLSRDLKSARVFISTLKDEDMQPALEILEAASPFIRSELRRSVRMKFTPTLKFILDGGTRQADHISRLLRDISEDK